MQKILFLIPFLPLAGAFSLGLWGRGISARKASVVGTVSVGASALVTLIVSCRFLLSAPAGRAYEQTLWTWIAIGDFRPEIAFRFDALALVMTLVVSWVGFLIHVYSVEFMRGEEGYSRFFAYMNLFVASMLTLVLADNFLLLYLGWEGVGLCSYLLIGFWYRNPENGRAARKAFIVTRIGDMALAIGIFLLFTHLGTLDISLLLARAASHWTPGWTTGSGLANVAAALLLVGAVGKSAQLPLQTWLPDAMAGPTPVSALIHAATMVTAGVYLIARTHTLFELAPPVQFVVAAIGAATLLISALSALVQNDIKRVLAYSTMSQVGYMFLALGVGAWSAAIFHFMTHAFFKALLFLGAGAVILALEHEHDILKMGGLRRKMPTVFWTFLIGAASLSALPFVTAGFYSKEMILSEVFAAPVGGLWLWIAGVVGAFLTSLYSFRLVFLVFFGEERSRPGAQPEPRPAPRATFLITVPLVILAGLSLTTGFVELPRWLAPYTPTHPGSWLITVASTVSLLGVATAYFLYMAEPVWLKTEPLHFGAVRKFLFSGWGFDWLYDVLWVRPFVSAAGVGEKTGGDLLANGITALHRALNSALVCFETGKPRWYAAVMSAGAIVVIILAEIR